MLPKGVMEICFILLSPHAAENFNSLNNQEGSKLGIIKTTINAYLTKQVNSKQTKSKFLILLS